MEKIEYDDFLLVKLLLENVAEFNSNLLPDFENSAYIIYDNFGSYLKSEIIRDSSLDGNSIFNAFEFLNSLYEDGDEKVRQMLNVTTLESLTEDNSVIFASRRFLKGIALRAYNEVVDLMNGTINRY